ncbi:MULTISPECIES: hypothetical protein [unclassified Moorena]|uniref:sulfotransferase-like domain-containing protein n=1 Tax=unclassified Moorena TaxID=2683338 RepID=UPI0013FE5016|nr:MULTISPECIES: hypothetical protein [unclassified Moorena]NEO17438.1 hypothetical protein [Moorena sp. SIO3E8]NEQ03984.1 hypothetical protein [Moorena sp. SIO3F7]
MKNNKHIAMWSCPRSRSTAMPRAFEQLDECMVFDEPLFGAYLVKRGLDQPCEEREVGQYLETNHEKVIQKITGSLPEGVSFSFQKHQSKHALPEFGRNWLKSLNNFFLIRNPKEIILSYHKLYKKKLTMDHIGIEYHYNLFREIELLIGKKAVVIDSIDIVNNTRKVLLFLCSEFQIKFSEKMLNWEVNPKASKLLQIEKSPYSRGWYSNVLGSRVFINKQQDLDFPEELNPLLEACMPYYNKLSQYRVTFNG